MAGLSYREHQPAAALRSFISCLWELSGPGEAGEAEPDRVLPDGHVELILHGGDPFLHHRPSGEVSRQSHAFVVGQLTGPLFLRPGGRVDVLGVRFRPGGLAPFVSLPVSELTGASVDVEDLWGGSGGWRAGSWIGWTGSSRSAGVSIHLSRNW